jgi:uncharacterized protein YdhG (YjbR/CyaY superfamily)
VDQLVASRASLPDRILNRRTLVEKIRIQSVDEYVDAQTTNVRTELIRALSAIRKALPRATEVISYGFPAYKINGKAAVYFAVWKKHYSIYPASRALLLEFEDELQKYTVEGSTIRFPHNTPLPVKLIARIAKFRAKEVMTATVRVVKK